MGRKKPSVRDEENLSAVARGGGKSKKKAVVIDDDEYSIGTEITEEPPEEKAVNNNKKKKGKKGNQKNLQAKDDDSKEDEGEENDGEAVVFTGKKKSKGKKNGGNNALSKSAFELLEGADKDDDDSGDKHSEGEDVSVVSKGKTKEGSKKGGNKSSSLFTAAAFDAIDGGSESEVIDNDHSVEESNDDDDVGERSKKVGKRKSSNTGFSASAFDLLDDEDEDVREDKDEEDEPIIFTDKKKKTKKSGTKSSAFDLLDNEDDDVKEDKDEEDEPITFTDNEKKSKKGGRMKSSAFDLLENEDEDDNEQKDVDVKKDKDKEDEPIIFTDKKKKTKSSKKTVNSFSEVLLNEENVVEDASVVSDVSGAVDTKQQSGDGSNDESHDSKVNKSEVVAETSKNKKKKKEKEQPRSGRTAQEEDDLEKVLAQLGGGPTPKEEKVQVQPPEPVAPLTVADEKGGVEEKEESAAAKKKKKKKEKEKEKKAAAAAAAAEDKQQGKSEAVETKKNDGKSKGPEKKMSKQVREMQEALARRKEAEERKKREEEERLRKEEEERKRLEELEKQAEEAKRRKKEREKEKLLKKKQDGKLLTGKQKEEARRLEAMRNQFLAKGISLPTGDKETAPKRPKYQTKKKSAQHQANGAAPVKEDSIESKEKEQEKQETPLEVDVGETEYVESLTVEEKPEIADAQKENGVEEEDDDDEEEWDAKSWDDVNLNVKGAFDDEEADSEPEPLVKKEITSAIPSPRDAAEKVAVAVKKAIPEQLVKSQDAVTRKKEAAAKSKAPEVDATPKQAEENLRSPICCIMGHVDTGKTKLLDCIRGTNVQEGEAGGITQQIGATYFPAENIRERTRELKADAKLKVPGLLVIDTPGHESFTNLRSRGSGLCDIAILVVDIMHGLEPQTIESLNLLKMRNTEFIVALNKVDRLYGWKTCRNAPIVKAMKQQTPDVQNEFNMRLVQIVTQFKEQGMNTELYYKNKDRGETFNIVPTSAISGEGIPDLLLLLVQWTQKTMVEKLTFRNEVQCTVLEVKVIEGHGTTIDVVLVNGVLHEGDQIVVCGLQGPIVTTIRALLTPHPMKELRVKGTYVHHKQIKAAQGIKITAQGLEHAIAGTGLYVVGPDDDLEDVKEEAMEDMKSVMSRIDKSGEGVCVQASTLGSLEALLEFLKSDAVKIPVSGISIGPVHKKDVMRASVMLEKKKEYATILAFDVKVTPEARELADELGVKIFIADIIYHLFDQFTAYINNLKEEKKREAADEAVFPCVLKILPNCVFNKKDPIVLGVDVLEGIAKVGTPICIPQRDFIDIGRIASIENNHKPVDTAKKGQKAAIKIVGSNSEEQQKMFGRHFDIEDELVSHISRKSIDVLKANYRDELTMDEWKLLVKLKNLFKIQ